MNYCMDTDDTRDIANEEKRAALVAILTQLRCIVSGFYFQAIKAGIHPFIEFCGLMGEYINMSQDALKADIDFRWLSVHEEPCKTLPVRLYRAKYLGEKFACIFLPWLADPRMRAVFLREAGLVETADVQGSLIQTLLQQVLDLTAEVEQLRLQVALTPASDHV